MTRHELELLAKLHDEPKSDEGILSLVEVSTTRANEWLASAHGLKAGEIIGYSPEAVVLAKALLEARAEVNRLRESQGGE